MFWQRNGELSFRQGDILYSIIISTGLIGVTSYYLVYPTFDNLFQNFVRMITMQQKSPENYDPKDLLMTDDTVARIAREVAEKSSVPLPPQKENISAAANTTVQTPTSTPTSTETSVKPVEEDSKREERLRKAKKARQEFESRVKRKRTDESDVAEGIDASVSRRDSAPAAVAAAIKSEPTGDDVLCEDEEFFNLVTMSQMQPARSGCSGGRLTPKRSKLQPGVSRSSPRQKSAR